ncbi:MAG: hypothetical protein SFU83_17045 [Meiothermus sp.]|nr:hypothetical protein [Meiothermus sp.]
MSNKASKAKPWMKYRRYGVAAIAVLATAGGAAGNLDSIMDLWNKFFGVSEEARTAPTMDVSGVWRAEVRYDWGVSRTEQFNFKLEGKELSGTASFLGVRRAILEGRMEGDTLRFVVKTQESLGGASETRELKHSYKGTASPDSIKFEMLTTGGFSEHTPIEFEAAPVKP